MGYITHSGKKYWSRGICRRCGLENQKLLWNLCEHCCKAMKDVAGESSFSGEWSFKENDKDDVDYLIWKMGYRNEKLES